jgi:gas vesicle protein
MGYDDYRRDSGDSISTRLTYLLIGGGIGAILALLFAPKSGQELRGDIADATRKGIDRSREAAQHLSDRAGEYYEATRERAGELYTQAAGRVSDVAQSRREAAAARAARFPPAIDAGKKAYQEEKAEDRNVRTHRSS